MWERNTSLSLPLPHGSQPGIIAVALCFEYPNNWAISVRAGSRILESKVISILALISPASSILPPKRGCAQFTHSLANTYLYLSKYLQVWKSNMLHFSWCVSNISEVWHFAWIDHLLFFEVESPSLGFVVDFPLWNRQSVEKPCKRKQKSKTCSHE